MGREGKVPANNRRKIDRKSCISRPASTESPFYSSIGCPKVGKRGKGVPKKKNLVAIPHGLLRLSRCEKRREGGPFYAPGRFQNRPLGISRTETRIKKGGGKKGKKKKLLNPGTSLRTRNSLIPLPPFRRSVFGRKEGGEGKRGRNLVIDKSPSKPPFA